MDALHDADAALEVQRLRLGRAGLGGEVVDGQHGLAGGAQIAEALADEGHIQRVGVLVVQRTVGQAGVILSALEELSRLMTWAGVPEASRASATL